MQNIIFDHKKGTHTNPKVQKMHSGANLQTESFCNFFVRKVSVKRELEEILGVLRNDVINSVTFFRVNESLHALQQSYSLRNKISS